MVNCSVVFIFHKTHVPFVMQGRHDMGLWLAIPFPGNRILPASRMRPYPKCGMPTGRPYS